MHIHTMPFFFGREKCRTNKSKVVVQSDQTQVGLAVCVMITIFSMAQEHTLSDPLHDYLSI